MSGSGRRIALAVNEDAAGSEQCSVLLGRRAAKAPKRVLDLADHVLGYLKTTADVALEYKRYGGEGQVGLLRDASFAPHGERSHQGLIYWKNSLIHWESKAQPFCTVSTTELELLGYTEGMTLGGPWIGDQCAGDEWPT